MTKKLKNIRLQQETILHTHSLIKPRQEIIEIAYNIALTQFNINDYIKQSKKSRRSEKLEAKEKPVFNIQWWVTGGI